MTIAFFAISGLDVLNSLDKLPNDQQVQLINWIYRHQVVPTNAANANYGGFLGSSTLRTKTYLDNNNLEQYAMGHLAMTYTGIANLLALGDDLSRLDKQAIIQGVAACQRPDGSFSASVEGNEEDMRFVYCAACICTMLNDWGRVDRVRMKEYILKSIRFDYGISQHMEMESHGGTTYCAVAALQMAGQLNELSPRMIERMKRWLIMRQLDGFQGRPNKIVDTCYSFWIGATLKILDAFHLANPESNRSYIISTQEKITGGFSKWPGSVPDPFHTYFGICGLSFLNEPGVAEVMPSLNISMRSYQRLLQIHEQWRINSTLNDVRLNIEM